jgi:hypothetical protein
MRKIILFLTLFLCTITAQTQTQGALGKRFFDNWSVGVSGGPNIFFGDLKVNHFWPASNNMNEWRFAGSVYLIRQLSHVFSIRGQLLYGQIAGTRRVYSDGTPCNQYFEGYLAEPNLNVMINFMNMFGYSPTRKFFIYGTVGLGMTFWHTKKYDLVSKAQIGEAGKTFPDWTKEGSIPAGLGAYYNIGDKINLGLEWTLRGLNSDRLDATVGGFQYDMYSYLSVNLTFNFNKRNQGTLKSANMGKNMGPVPPKPDIPAAEKTTEKPADLYQQKPSLKSPGINDTVQYRKPAIDENLNSGNDQREEVSETPLQTGPVEPGLSYRVQVFAFRTDSHTTESVQNRFHLTGPVYKEYTDGWYRFTVGSFKTLQAAKAFLVQVKTKNKVKDAFIARYEDGVRIPTHPKQ